MKHEKLKGDTTFSIPLFAEMQRCDQFDQARTSGTNTSPIESHLLDFMNGSSSLIASWHSDTIVNRERTILIFHRVNVYVKPKFISWSEL
jgi:hypothetical protein